MKVKLVPHQKWYYGFGLKAWKSAGKTTFSILLIVYSLDVTYG